MVAITFQSWPDCIINTSGYDFRKGQVLVVDEKGNELVVQNADKPRSPDG
jgi:hypothetical protein